MLRFVRSPFAIRTLWLLLQLVLLAAGALAASNAARAADCDSVSNACLNETIARSGTARTLSVKITRTWDAVDHFNVIVPGFEQKELKPGGTLKLTVPEDGKAVYSVQACQEDIVRPWCNSWKKVVRNFPAVGGCNDYASAAIVSLLESNGLGCGFGGERWNPNFHAHFDACMDQSEGFQGFLTNETNLRAADLAACKASKVAASQPIKKTGKPRDGGGAPIPPGVLACQGGGMAVTEKDGSVFVNFAPAGQPADQALPGPGECAWGDRVVGGGEARRIAFRRDKPNARLLIEAARAGGTFNVRAQAISAFIMVSEIVSVNVVDSGLPAVPDDAGGEELPVPATESSECPAGVATVATAQVGEEVLNVRAKPSRDAEIVAQVPDGSQVSVVGACFTGGAGFAKGKTLKPKGDGGKTRPDQAAQAGGWCRIDAPAQGCVKAEFLAFGQAPGKGAGLAKAKTLKPQGDGNAGEQPGLALTFAGKWSVTGDDGVGYSMTMTQKGTSVSGNYRGGDGSKGSFKGKVKGNVLRFSWKQTDGYSGSGKFALSDDGSSFDGSYSFGDNPDEAEGSWSGTRN